jgi:hypothetical protein
MQELEVQVLAHGNCAAQTQGGAGTPVQAPQTKQTAPQPSMSVQAGGDNESDSSLSKPLLCLRIRQRSKKNVHVLSTVDYISSWRPNVCSKSAQHIGGAQRY